MALDVLIADDDATTRLILETLLSRKGHRFQSHADGKSALDARQINNPKNLRLLDLVADVVRSSYNKEMVLLKKWVNLDSHYIKRKKEWGRSNLFTDTIPVIELSQFARNAKLVMS